MAEDSDLERTEPPSARKLQQARDKGQVPRSRELATLAVLLAASGTLAVLGVFMLQGLSRIMVRGMSFDRGALAGDSMQQSLSVAGFDALILILPMALAVVVAVIAANLMVSGWIFSTQVFEPNLSKLLPLAGLKRMFSLQSLVELLKALLKGGLIAGMAGWMIWRQRDDILTLSAEPLEQALAHFGQITLYTFVAALAAFALLVLFDVPYQIWQHRKGLRMTKEELKQEHKDLEGDPRIKARIRALQREQARRRMMQAVPTADVVVTNPLHFAVALVYDEKKMAAPQVVAKGSQLIAERIKELARENRVPIVEAPPLARALHRHVEIGDSIPGTLFTAVAQVLAYVYQLNQSMNPSLPSEWQVPKELDPLNRAEVQH